MPTRLRVSNYLPFGFILLLLSGCVTIYNQSSHPNLEERIKNAEKEIAAAY